MVQSVTRALTLLNEVANYPEGVGVRQLSRDVGLKVPTAQALLKTLARMGFLDFDMKERRYRIGFAVMGLANSVNNNDRLKTLCRDAIEDMVADFGETALAGSLQGMRVGVVYSSSPDQPLAVEYKEQIIEHPHCLAIGKVLLAHQETAFLRAYGEQEPLGELGVNSPANIDEMLSDLNQVRHQGYAEAINVSGQGIDAFSVPVFDKYRQCKLALGCSAPIARVSPRKRTLMLARLFEHSEYISEQFYGVAGEV